MAVQILLLIQRPIILLVLVYLDQQLSHQPVVVVCHSGSRSPLATQQLHKAGLSQVANLRGGLSRWGDEGYPLESVTAS